MEKNKLDFETRKMREDMRQERRRLQFPFLMMSPFIILTLIFVCIPIVLMILMSFTDMGITLEWNFIGFTNYKKIFTNPEMGKIILRTLLLSLIHI